MQRVIQLGVLIISFACSLDQAWAQTPIMVMFRNLVKITAKTGMPKNPPAIKLQMEVTGDDATADEGANRPPFIVRLTFVDAKTGIAVDTPAPIEFAVQNHRKLVGDNAFSRGIAEIPMTDVALWLATAKLSLDALALAQIPAIWVDLSKIRSGAPMEIALRAWLWALDRFMAEHEGRIPVLNLHMQISRSNSTQAWPVLTSADADGRPYSPTPTFALVAKTVLENIQIGDAANQPIVLAPEIYPSRLRAYTVELGNYFEKVLRQLSYLATRLAVQPESQELARQQESLAALLANLLVYTGQQLFNNANLTPYYMVFCAAANLSASDFYRLVHAYINLTNAPQSRAVAHAKRFLATQAAADFIKSTSGQPFATLNFDSATVVRLGDRMLQLDLVALEASPNIITLANIGNKPAPILPPAALPAWLPIR